MAIKVLLFFVWARMVSELERRVSPLERCARLSVLRFITAIALKMSALMTHSVGGLGGGVSWLYAGNPPKLPVEIGQSYPLAHIKPEGEDDLQDRIKILSMG